MAAAAAAVGNDSLDHFGAVCAPGDGEDQHHCQSEARRQEGRTQYSPAELREIPDDAGCSWLADFLTVQSDLGRALDAPGDAVHLDEVLGLADVTANGNPPAVGDEAQFQVRRRGVGGQCSSEPG